MKNRYARIFLISIFCFVGLSAFALDESSLPSGFFSVALPYFQAVAKQVMRTSDGVQIVYRYFPTRGRTRGTIVIVNGRTEYSAKYAELLYDLKDSGYNIYIYDQRGQGESSRLIADPLKGYVGSYRDYVSDLKQLIDSVVRPQEKGPLFILAHSVGGAVAAEYLVQNPKVVRAMAVSSPMYAPDTSPWPEDVALGVLEGEILIGHSADYAMGYHAEDWDEPFASNKVNTSLNRFTYNHEFMENSQKLDEVLVVSSPTNQWGRESILLGKDIRWRATQLRTPTLVLEAGDEEVVIQQDEVLVCQQAKHCEVKLFKGSKHEIYMETDSIRNAAIRSTLEFFRKYL